MNKSGKQFPLARPSFLPRPARRERGENSPTF